MCVEMYLVNNRKVRWYGWNIQNNKKKVREDIIERFESGQNLSGIAKDLEMNRAQIRKVLVENNLYKIITLDEKRTILENNREKIIEFYSNNYSLKKIKTHLKEQGIEVETRTLKNFLEKWGVKIKSARDYNKKFTSDDKCFSKYSVESCYWAGIIASDGCIFSHGRADKKNNYLSIGVSEIDSKMIERFKTFSKYTGKLYRGKRSKQNHHDCIEIRLNNINIVKDLEKNFNITSAKSLTYIPPNIPKKYVKYFILGLLDGDGCITYYTTNTGRKHFGLSFVGTKETCEYIKKFLKSDVKLFKRYKESDKNNYSFVIQGNIQIYKILSNLYDEKVKDICLERKYNKFLELKEQINNTYNLK